MQVMTHRRFVEMAHEVEADEGTEAFDAALNMILGDIILYGTAP
jgi:hypothetical protein